MSDWTVLSLSAFLFLSKPEFRLLSATPQRDTEMGELKDGEKGRENVRESTRYQTFDVVKAPFYPDAYVQP